MNGQCPFAHHHASVESQRCITIVIKMNRRVVVEATVRVHYVYVLPLIQPMQG